MTGHVGGVNEILIWLFWFSFSLYAWLFRCKGNSRSLIGRITCSLISLLALIDAGQVDLVLRENELEFGILLWAVGLIGYLLFLPDSFKFNE